MISLTFQKPHRSIVELPDIELPDFAVITGVNGSGKTHLLEAITKGFVKVESLAPTEVRRYDWSSLNVKLDEVGDPLERRKRKIQANTTTQKAIQKARTSICGWFSNQGYKDEECLTQFEWLLAAEEHTIVNIISKLNRGSSPPQQSARFAKSFAEHFLKHRDQAVTEAMQSLTKFGEYSSALAARAGKLETSVLLLSDYELEQCLPLSWSGTDSLEFRFAELFSSYFSTWERNRINRYYAEVDKLTNHSWLGDAEFILRYGPPPWEIANSTLESAGLRYRFNFPTASIEGDSQFTLRLTDPSDPLIALKPQDLSSGERILLSITLLLYQLNSNHQLSTLPRLLLLDEVDAPLHPSFTRVLLQLLKDTLVERHSIKILLTTHSPSTVALAPEGALYELQRSPRTLRPISRAHAVQELASGFISVMPSSRVVIAESSTDATIHAQLQQCLVAANVLSDYPPLNFIPASKVGNDGLSGGATQVEIWAPKLDEIFDQIGFRGIVDRDNGRTSAGVIQALNRYSIENYILDPLTIAVLFIKDGNTEDFTCCPIDNMNIHLIPLLEKAALQGLVNDVVRWIESDYPALTLNHPGQFSVGYLFGAELLLPCWVRDFRGHDLKNLCKKILNQMCSTASRPIALPGRDVFSRLLEVQTRCLPLIIPSDLRDVYQALKS